MSRLTWRAVRKNKKGDPDATASTKTGFYASIYVSDLRNAQNKYAALAATVVPFLAN